MMKICWYNQNVFDLCCNKPSSLTSNVFLFFPRKQFREQLANLPISGLTLDLKDFLRDFWAGTEKWIDLYTEELMRYLCLQVDFGTCSLTPVLK